MSREPYNSVPTANSGARSPGGRATSRRLTELPTVDQSPSRDYASHNSPQGEYIFQLHFISIKITLISLLFPNNHKKKNIKSFMRVVFFSFFFFGHVN